MIWFIAWVALAWFYWRICQTGAEEDERAGMK